MYPAARDGGRHRTESGTRLKRLRSHPHFRRLLADYRCLRIWDSQRLFPLSQYKLFPLATCPNGHPVESGTAFCGRCGIALVKGGEEPSAAPNVSGSSAGDTGPSEVRPAGDVISPTEVDATMPDGTRQNPQLAAQDQTPSFGSSVEAPGEGEAKSAAPAFCEQCGSRVQQGSAFCASCGNPLTGDPPPAPGSDRSLNPGSLPPPPLLANPTYVYAAPQPPTTTNGMSVASLVLGLVWLAGVGSILAIIFGSVARKQIRANGGRQTGRGMAGWGIALGIIGLVGAALWVVLLVVAAHEVTACENSGGVYIGSTCVHTGSGNTGSTGNTGSSSGNSSNSGNSGSTSNTGTSGNSG